MPRRFTMFVLTNAVKGRDDEFNDWYSGRHVRDVLNVPGFVAGQRFKAVTSPGAPAPKFAYGATYDLETDDPLAAVAELFARHDTPDLPSSDAMHPVTYFGLFEAITPVIAR